MYVCIVLALYICIYINICLFVCLFVVVTVSSIVINKDDNNMYYNMVYQPPRSTTHAICEKSKCFPDIFNFIVIVVFLSIFDVVFVVVCVSHYIRIRIA